MTKLIFRRSASLGFCDKCGKRTCMLTFIRDSVYPYVHKIFRCSKCIRSFSE